MKNLFIVGLLCVFAVSVYSQPRGGDKNHDRIETMKISFITQRLDLTPEQAQSFWPVYNQMSNQMKAIRDKKRGDDRKSFDELSDKEVEANIEAELKKEQEVLDLKKQYIADLKGVLSIKQVAKLLMAEEQFKRRLIQHMSDRKNQNNNRMNNK